MFELFSIFTALFFGITDGNMQQPTNTQIVLVEKLGSDKWEVREKAHKELKELGREAILAVERHGFPSKDLEVKRRSEYILNSFHTIANNDNRVPSITGLFKMPEFRLPSGKQFKAANGTAKLFYESVGGDHRNEDQGGYEEYHLMHCQQATQRFTRTLLRTGYERQDVRRILDKMQDNEEKWRWYDLKYDEDQVEYTGQYFYQE